MGAGPDRRSQWLRGVLEACVLATVRDEPRYGYEIIQLLEQAGLGQIKGGTIYPVLGRLEEAGLVLTEWRPGESGPNRKYYVLTDAGTEMLHQLAGDWQRFTEIVATILPESARRDQ